MLISQRQFVTNQSMHLDLWACSLSVFFYHILNNEYHYQISHFKDILCGWVYFTNTLYILYTIYMHFPLCIWPKSVFSSWYRWCNKEHK